MNVGYWNEADLVIKVAVAEIADDSLIVRIDASSPTFRDPKGWSAGGVHSGRFFTHESKFKVTNDGQVNYAIELLRQAFEIVQS